jgi:Asp-tRNA(Asn)/Glu-tRNA(Gln) amidotransferase A subunit family amidase
MTGPAPLSIAALAAAYREGRTTPREAIGAALARCAADTRGAWIRVLTDAEVAPYLAALDGTDPTTLPLFGIPFAIKDNIDLAGIPTTAGCPEYAYTPARSAHVVERLVAAGAVPLGKTNLDQFAAGLVGVRSPYGACRNALDQEYLAGGSSSGSAVAVALGQVAFALGTDTAGSGRIPAAFNGLVGLKPTRGLLSTAGVVPACASLDCVSVFATTAADAAVVFEVARAFDAAHPFSRRGGHPETKARRRCANSSVTEATPPLSMPRCYGSKVSVASRSRSTSPRSPRRRACSTRDPGWPSASWPSKIFLVRIRTPCTRSRAGSSPPAAADGPPIRSRPATAWPPCGAPPKRNWRAWT